MSASLYVVGETTAARIEDRATAAWSTVSTVEYPGQAFSATAVSTGRGARLYIAVAADGGSILTLEDSGGVLSPIANTPSGGDLPCSLVVRDDLLAVADYRRGAVRIHRLTDGVPGDAIQTVLYEGGGPDGRRQDASHIHAVLATPGKLFSVDLGADRVHIHDWGVSGVVGRPADTTLPPGTGPRHAVVLTDEHLLTANELDSSLSLVRHGSGDTPGETVARLALPGSPSTGVRDYPSDVVVAGQHVFAATRGADLITHIVRRGTELVVVDEHASGRWPMKLEVRGSRLYCAARDDDAVHAWDIDAETGRLSATRTTIAESPRPVWVGAAPSAALRRVDEKGIR